MPSQAERDYWQQRASRSFRYRGETFYTTTPPAFYRRRRRRLLRRLEAVLRRCPPRARVLDFGCGDGFYCVHFARRCPHLEFFGCDISESMIHRARRRSAAGGGACRFARSDGPVPFPGRFDVILVVAVLAHVLEPSEQRAVARELHLRLAPGGRLVVFEATTTGAPARGAAWQRLRPHHYRRLFAEAGLRLVSEELICFPFYERVGKRLLSAVAARAFGGFLAANARRSYQLLGEAVMAVGAIFDWMLPRRVGNTLFVFEPARPVPAGARPSGPPAASGRR